MRLLAVAPAVLCWFVACDVAVPSNTDDPDDEETGVVSGSVEMFDDFDSEARLRQLAAVRVGLVDKDGQRVEADGVPLSRALTDLDGGAGVGSASGLFAIKDLEPGGYTLVVEGVSAFYRGPQPPGVDVVAGASVDVGALTFTFDGDANQGPGLIAGELRADEQALGQVTVRLYQRRGDDVVLVREATSAAGATESAAFSFSGLSIGSYALVAESPGFVPVHRLGLDVSTATPAHQFDGVDALLLSPARTALAVATGDTTRLQGGIIYTRGDSVDVDVLPLDAAAAAGVTGMRLSIDPGFLDEDGGSAAFLPVAASATLSLPDVDGVVQVFLQLEARSQRFRFVSQVFSVSLVRDSVPPRIVEATLLGLQRDVGGTFLSRTPTLTVRVDATDDDSAVAGFDASVGAAPPVLAATSGPPGQVRLERTVSAAADGAVVVFVGIEDRAGNRAPDVQLRALVDASAPDVSLVVDNAVGGVLRTRSAVIDFDVSGALVDPPVVMQVRALGQAFSDDLPFGPTTVFIDSSLGDGDVVVFEALLVDRVGNEAVVSGDVTLALQGTFVGRVTTAGVGASATGATVTLSRDDVVVALDDVDADSLFALPGVPEGAGYALEVSLDGYRTARRPALVMPTPAADGSAAVVDLEDLDLALARGDLSARFRLDDQADVDDAHADIDVTLTLQSPDRVFAQLLATNDAGDVVFADLPATRVGESYELVAKHDGYGTGSVVGLVVSDASLSVAPATLLPLNIGDFEICALTGAECVQSPFINTDAVRVQLVDLTGVVRLRVAINGGGTRAIALDDDNLTVVDLLGAAEGNVILTVHRDLLDGSTSQFSRSFVLDQTAPAADFSVSAGAAFATSTSAAADFSRVVETNAPLKFKTSTSALDCGDPAGYLAFSSSSAVTLDPGDGTKTVLACLKDPAGNTTALADSIVLDQTDPDVAFTLEGSGPEPPGAGFARDRAIGIRISALAADARAVAIAEGVLPCATASFALLPLPLPALPTSLPFDLGDVSDGAKTVSVCVQDAAGRTNGANGTSNTITLDATAPTSPAFATPSLIVGPLSAPVSMALQALSADAGGSGLRSPRSYDLVLPNGLSCTSLDGGADETALVGSRCQWSGLAFTVAVAALGVDGDKHFFVDAVDVAGNASAPDVLTLTVDSVSPTKPCFESNCATPATLFTSSTSVSLDLDLASTDLHFGSYQACSTTGASCNCTPADVPGASFSVVVAPNATSRVCVRARDAANNVSLTDTQIVVHDDVAPSAPVFALPLDEVTGSSTLLLFSSASTSHTDPNFSHFEVRGGGHTDTIKLCPSAVAPLCNSATRSRFFLDVPAPGTPAAPVSLLVDLEPETTNTFEVQAVDRAGNASATTVVEVFEGSLTIAQATSERPNRDTMVGFGDRVAFLIDDGVSGDVTDSARVIGPGLDLRFGTADDENLVFSSFVLATPNTAATFDDDARQVAALSGGSAGIAFIEGFFIDATHAGTLDLLPFGNDSVFVGDFPFPLTPFPSFGAPVGCGEQKGFRNPSMSQGRILVTCFASDTNHDVFLLSPGPNGVFEFSGDPGRDDTFTAIAGDPVLREHLPVLSDETAAWMLEVSAESFTLQVRRPGADGLLGAAGALDDDTSNVATDIPAAQVTQPGLYFPEDPSVPACQRGLVYATAALTILHHNPGADGLFAESGGDDVRTVIESSAAGPIGALHIGPGVISYQTGSANGPVVISPGPNRCYEAEGAVGSDDERTELGTLAAAGVAVANGGWFEFSTPGIFLNQLLFHDLLTRRPLLAVQQTPVDDDIMGADFALFASGTGDIKLIDFDDLLLRSKNDASIFKRSFISSGPLIASNDDDVDAINIVAPGIDGDLLSNDDVTVLISSDAVGGAVIDDLQGSQRNFGMSTSVIAWLSGTEDPGFGFPNADVRIQFAGADQTFQRDDGTGGEDDCQVNISGGNLSRGFVSVDGTRVTWLDRTVASSAGQAMIFEPTVANLPCGGGSITPLTNATFPNVTMPMSEGKRVVAFATDAFAGTPLGLLLFDTPSEFRNFIHRRRSCRLPTGWSVPISGDGLAFFEGSAVFTIQQGGLQKTAMCDLASDMVRIVDANQPGSSSVSASGPALVLRSAASDSVSQLLLDR